MTKIIPKILIITFLFIFLFQLAGLIFLLTVPEQAQAGVKFKPQVEIPDMDKEFKGDIKEGYNITPTSIGSYIKLIYKYAIGIVGILATVVMMLGGVIWITAGGNASRIGEAKAWIGASLTGLILALCSYMILNTINPDLVSFRPIDPTKVEKIYEKKQDVGEKCSAQEPCISGLTCRNKKCVNDCEGDGEGTPCVADGFPNGGHCVGIVKPSCSKCREKGENCIDPDPSDPGKSGQWCCSGFSCSGWNFDPNKAYICE